MHQNYDNNISQNSGFFFFLLLFILLARKISQLLLAVTLPIRNIKRAAATATGCECVYFLPP